MIRSSLRRPSAFYRNVWALAMPIVLQNMITTSLGFVDTFMVGLVGNNELSAVTAANSLVFLVQMIIFGLMSGLAILVSQYWGKGDLEAINRATGVALYVAAGVSLVVASLFFFFPGLFMSLVTDNAILIDIATPYLKVVGLSLFFNTMSSVYIGMQRSTENPRLGMLIFGCSMLLNTILNYFLIFGNHGAPQLGVLGAAVATLISRILECVLVAGHIASNRRIPLRPHWVFAPGLHSFQAFFRHSLPVLMNELIWGLGTTVMVSILGHMVNSADMLAAYAIIGNIDKFAIAWFMGLAAAASVLVGKAIGEGQSNEEVQSLSTCLLVLSFGCGTVVGIFQGLLLPLAFQPYLFPLFNLSPEATHIAVVMCLCFVIIMPPRAFDFTAITGALRAGGDVNMALVIDLVPLWCFAIPVAALLGLVLHAPVWTICFFGIHGETMLKMPWGAWRIHSRKWIHNLTLEGSK